MKKKQLLSKKVTSKAKARSLHSFNKYLLVTSNVPITVLGAGEKHTALRNQTEIPAITATTILFHYIQYFTFVYSFNVQMLFKDHIFK